MLNVALAIGGGLLVLYGITCICANYALLYLSARSQRDGAQRFYSLVPIAGPLALSLVWLNVTTIPGTLLWAPLVPWIIDPGTWLLVVGALKAIKRMRIG